MNVFIGRQLGAQLHACRKLVLCAEWRNKLVARPATESLAWSSTITDPSLSRLL